jgi:hypothetical protein
VDTLSVIDGAMAIRRDVVPSHFVLRQKGRKKEVTMQWENVHIFISSTFNDMHAERDYDRFYAELGRFPLTDAVKDEMKAEIAYAPDIDAEWDDEDEEAMRLLLPKLCKAFDW